MGTIISKRLWTSTHGVSIVCDAHAGATLSAEIARRPRARTHGDWAALDAREMFEISKILGRPVDCNECERIAEIAAEMIPIDDETGDEIAPALYLDGGDIMCPTHGVETPRVFRAVSSDHWRVWCPKCGGSSLADLGALVERRDV